MATVRHLGRWLHRRRPLFAGNPFENVTDVRQDEPDWNGLTDRQIMRLKAADRHGIHYAQSMSGNVSMKEIFRYTKPSEEELEEAAERIFE